jgi:hypothetical protein
MTLTEAFATRALLFALLDDADAFRALSHYATDVLSDADIADPVDALADMVRGYLSEYPPQSVSFAATAINWRVVARFVLQAA